MTNTTASATDSDDYSNIGKGLSSVPINNLVLIMGSIVLLSAIVCAFWQFSRKKGSEISVTESPQDCKNTGNESAPLPRHKSVRFADEKLTCRAHVTPQVVPIPTQVSIPVGTEQQDAKSPKRRQSKRSSIVTNLFRSLSRSLSLFSPKSESGLEDLEIEVESRSRRISDHLSDVDECLDISEGYIVEMNSDLADHISEESTTASSTLTPRKRQEDAPMTRNRSQSEPTKADENGFFVGEEVQYRGKSRWKRGVVTSINPLKVQGEGNYRSHGYEQVRKLRVLPSKIGEEVDDMDVNEMTFDDFKRLMRSARQNTRTGRDLLADTAKRQSQLVEVLARNQK